VGLALFAGCSIELDDVPGRACDDQHACRAPRACIRGACLTPAEADAGVAGDAGVSDGGVLPFDAGTSTDGGVARWQQRLHGFTGTTIDTNCALDIDPSRGNRVLATVLSADDAQDTATAEMVDVNRLPRTLEGRMRGRLTLPAPLAVRDFVPVVFLGTQTGLAFARVGFDGQGRIRVESDAQTVGSSALVERFSVDGGFSAGDWVVEVAWRAGVFREVRLNDVVLSTTTVTGGATQPPDELSLGPARYDGDAGTAFSITLSGWQLADDLTVNLGVP